MTPVTPSHRERVAIVSGASSGIGEASARSLARRGFRVALVARRAERLAALAKEIEAAGGAALALPADLAEEAATASLVPRTLEHFGRVDVLVNVAGYSPAGAAEQVSREAVRHAFEVNLFAALQLVREVTPVMRAQGGGRIVNIGSLGGSVPAPLAVPYGATKAGLDVATRSLRLELRPWNIKVSLVVPGFVRTDVFENTKRASTAFREDPENPYRQLFFDLEDFANKSLESALAPERIGEIVALAATARRPRLRYYAPLSARLQDGLLGALPEAWVDALLRRVYKIPPPGGGAFTPR
jgi:short-subunit dehydrogenase